MPAKPKSRLEASGTFRLTRGGENLLDVGRFDLLAQIAATGSITKAGKAVGISYRTAWLAVDRLNALSEKPLVERSVGGRSGGGTRLTAAGRRLLETYSALQEEHGRYLGRLEDGAGDIDRFQRLARKLSLRTSARNQYFGKVESIDLIGVEALVVLRLKGGIRIAARITAEGLESLGIREGEEAYALIKSNWVGLEVTARRGTGVNRFAGRVRSLRTGSGKVEVVVDLPGGMTMVAMVPADSVETLALREGASARAVVDPENVILGVAR